MTPEALACVLVGLGLYLAVTALPFGAPEASLDEQLERFQVDSARERPVGGAASRPLLPWAPLDAALGPLLEDLARPVQRLVGSHGPFGSELDRWLVVLAPGTSRLGFLTQATAWGLLLGALVLFGMLSRGGAWAPALICAGLFAVVGFLAPVLVLRARARKRGRRVLAELPHVAGLLSVALSAGLPLDVALGQAGQQSSGTLGRELVRAQHMVGSGGWGLHEALATMAERERVSQLDTFVAQLRAADEQGLVLGNWLDTFVQTLQEQRATRLLAEAEQASVKMVFPLALVMAPVSVVIVLAPGLMALTNLVGR
jgi:hypothetical protein